MKNTKKALLLSVMSLVLCLSMLVGTTFAWFTDSVSTANNTIASGNLDVELYWSTDCATWEKVTETTNVFKDGALWEPGYTEVVYLQVRNEGSLHLKYQMAVQVNSETTGTNVAGETFKLSDYILYGIADTDAKYADRAEARAALAETAKLNEAYNSGTLTLAPKGQAGDMETVAMVVYMPETVNNDANHLTGTAAPTINLALSVQATQVEAEEDSFDETYDKDAWNEKFMVNTYQELAKIIEDAEDGDVIVFGDDIENADGILITDKDITLDLNGKTFTVSEGASTNNRVIKINGDAKVTVKNGTLIADGDTNSGAYGTIRTEGTAQATLENLKLYNYRGGGLNVKAVSGTKVVINDCEIYSQYGGGVEASGGEIVLNNTKIEQKGVYENGWYSVAIELNSSGKVTVNSGEYSGSAIATDANAAKGNAVAFVLSSGGTLEINGGTFTGIVAETAAAGNFCGLIYADRAAVVNINGGTFNSNGAILDMRNNAGTQPNPVATLKGGSFSADPTVSGLYSSNLIKLGDGCMVYRDTAGNWNVAPGGVYDNAVMGGLYELLPTLKSGDVLILPEGTYETSGTFTVAAGVTIMGEAGKEVIIHQNSAAQDDIFNCAGDVTIENITFESNRKGYAVAGNTKEHDTDGNITIRNCKFKGIAVEKNYGVYKNLNGNLVIENCTFDNYNNAICGVNNGNGSTTTITGCTFTNINGEAIGYVSSTLPADFEANAIANNTGLTAENVIGY